MSKKIEDLQKYLEKMNRYNHVVTLLYWDMRTGMPKGGLYFPSYLLGNVYDGMLREQVEKELGSIDTILAEGRIMEITKWLNEKIHK